MMRWEDFSTPKKSEFFDLLKAYWEEWLALGKQDNPTQPQAAQNYQQESGQEQQIGSLKQTKSNALDENAGREEARVTSAAYSPVLIHCRQVR
ncbi:unnamed protein product [Protopolystoma xenopodis]|uniref:Uncharacterized protein n=1 Tax=Protopolystoma xenopodis TaxID=117903 RepID=A0A3S5BWC4_9PLAT|nr:unnamed protein product [Protopolystoma xenopodis]